jgi:hypothetical protein
MVSAAVSVLAREPYSQLTVRQLSEGMLRSQPFCSSCRPPQKAKRPLRDFAAGHDLL